MQTASEEVLSETNVRAAPAKELSLIEPTC